MPRSTPVAFRTLALIVVALVACESASPSPSASDPVDSPSAVPSEAPTPDMSAYEGLWTNATSDTIGTTADYTNRVELADITGDGLLDILFANGGNYDFPSPDGPVASQVFVNQGAGRPFVEAMPGMLVGYTRVIKVRDLNRDLNPDIVMGTTWQTQSQLFLGRPDGTFTNATANLPQMALSVGDLEIGDVDADGDLDMALVDWGGPGSPFDTGGGLVHLWLNDGSARFTDATAAQMPETLISFSWDLELMDVNNDWDLDLAISAKVSRTSFLFENDGTGRYTDVTDTHLPHFTNNYEFEPMDLDGDGFLDLVTVNDGFNLAEHAFGNNGDGTFSDMTDTWWPEGANLGFDDNAEVFLDVESDGDADFLLFSLEGSDRLLVNDGTGRLTLVNSPIDAPPSRGSLGAALGDLDGDGRLDIVESQGEVPGSFDERVYLATSSLAPDTAPPHVRTDLAAGSRGTITVHARVTDGLSPYVPGHPDSVWVTWDQAADTIYGLSWYGEYLFRTTVEVPEGATGLQVCAVDAAGNETCLPLN